jgi:hypothetical protein
MNGETMYTNTELIKPETLAELAATWQRNKKRILEACALLNQAEKELRTAFRDTYRFSVSSDKLRTDEPDSIIDRMKAEAWAALIDRMELRKLLSVRRARELDHALETGNMPDGSALPDVTEERIIDMMKSFATNVDAFMSDAVKEVFDWLRPRGTQYKTNDRFEIGRRVILTGVVERKFMRSGYRIRYNFRAEVRALDNVFHLLDGRGAVPTHYGELYEAIECSETGRGETTYFRFACFRNGHLHLTIKRDDLRQRLNALAGGMNLRPEGVPRT